MFREARGSNLNLVAIGGQLDAYRAALESRYELDTDGEELDAFLSAPTIMGPAAKPAAAQHKTRRSARGDVTTASRRNGKPVRKGKSAPTSARSRSRRSSRPGSI